MTQNTSNFSLIGGFAALCGIVLFVTKKRAVYYRSKVTIKQLNRLCKYDKTLNAIIKDEITNAIECNKSSNEFEDLRLCVLMNIYYLCCAFKDEATAARNSIAAKNWEMPDIGNDVTIKFETLKTKLLDSVLTIERLQSEVVDFITSNYSDGTKIIEQPLSAGYLNGKTISFMAETESNQLLRKLGLPYEKKQALRENIFKLLIKQLPNNGETMGNLELVNYENSNDSNLRDQITEVLHLQEELQKCRIEIQQQKESREQLIDTDTEQERDRIIMLEERKHQGEIAILIGIIVTLLFF